MRVRNKRKILICIGVLAVLLLIFSMLELSWASTMIPFDKVIDTIMGHGSWANNILVKDNAIRLMMALLVGSGLAVCGCTMQAVFRNPMASPYIIGLSSGASLGAAVGILITVPLIPYFILAPVLSSITCFLTMMLVYGVSRMGGKAHTETLILTGIAVSSMLSAVVSFLTFIAGDKMADIVFWSMGSLSRADLTEALIIMPIIILGVMLIISYSKSLNAMMLGDFHAMDLGIDVAKVRLTLLVLTTIVVAAAVSFAGTIGFVGLISPHIARLLIGNNNRFVLPMSMVIGALFVVLANMITRSLEFDNGVIPVGVMMSFIGAPLFLALIISRKKSGEVF